MVQRKKYTLIFYISVVIGTTSCISSKYMVDLKFSQKDYNRYEQIIEVSIIDKKETYNYSDYDVLVCTIIKGKNVKTGDTISFKVYEDLYAWKADVKTDWLLFVDAKYIDVRFTQPCSSYDRGYQKFKQRVLIARSKIESKSPNRRKRPHLCLYN